MDADIKGFFKHVNHEWLMKFLDLRIGDPNIHRLVRRMLKAGIQEDSQFEPTEEGTPQGSIASPVLANVYLHYVLDLWFEIVVKKQCKGQAEIVRFADDFVCCFQFKEDAERFYAALLLRLEKFKLNVAGENNLMYKWLNRRSQRRSFTRERFKEVLKRLNIPKPRIYVSIYRSSVQKIH